MSQSLDSLISILTEKLNTITDSSTSGEDLLLISKAISQINEVQASEAQYQSLLERLTQLESLVHTNGENTSALISENDSKINALSLSLNEYKANKNNPNNVTKNQVGLNLVDNYGNTDDITDSSIDKYALAKGVNTIWNKVKEQKFIDAPKDNNFYVRQNEKWVQPPETSPIGSVTAYYGEAAPKGWLALDGSIINKTEYKRLYEHIVNLRKAPAYEDIQLGDWTHSEGGESWVNGITVNGDSGNDSHHWRGNPTLTFLAIGDNPDKFINQISNNISLIDGKYLHAANSKIVIRIEKTNINDKYAANFTVLGGTVEEAASTYRHPARFNVYHSLADIPVSDSECFLPDTRDLAITGFNHLDSRKMGSFEQDAIRNIEGTIQITDYSLPNTMRNFSNVTGAFEAIGSTNGVHSLTYKIIGNDTYPEQKPVAKINASRVVPVAEENRIKNINLLWIIKAYDVISNPEQIESQIIIDRVNLNTSKVEALENEISNCLKTEIKRHTVTIASATDVWVETGIKGDDLLGATYLVRVYAFNEAEGIWYERAVGIMQWYSNPTNEGSTSVDNITLHQSGHHKSGKQIALRVVRHLKTDPIDRLTLQLSLINGTNIPVEYSFTFLLLL